MPSTNHFAYKITLESQLFMIAKNYDKNALHLLIRSKKNGPIAKCLALASNWRHYLIKLTEE